MRSPVTSNSTQKKRLTTAVQIGLILSVSHIAYAEDIRSSIGDNETATPSTTLDIIAVYADSYRSTGTKSRLDRNDAPMSYTRIDQELLQKRQADSVNAARALRARYQR